MTNSRRPEESIGAFALMLDRDFAVKAQGVEALADSGHPKTTELLRGLLESDLRYLPEIVDGDKRILLIDGEPVPYALARKPAKGETRANLATGGTGVGVELSERDRWICQQVAPVLKEKGLLFVGLDVIGDYLTEINVTSPTCIRELDSLYGLNISAGLFNSIEARLA